MYHTSLDEIVIKMKNMGQLLIPYNWPMNTMGDEDDISLLKTLPTTVDGYEVFVHYNKSDHEDYYLETIQIFGQKIPFIPFCVVCKIAKKFLGVDFVYFFELIQENKKIYIWVICTNKDGVPIENPKQKNAEIMEYDGFKYRIMETDSVQFY